MKRRVDRPLSSQTAVGGRRPEAVTGHPIRIAVVRARRYAYEMSARLVASPRKAGDCCLSCIVIVCFAQFLFSFVQRLPTDLGRTFIAARQGQASNKAEHLPSGDLYR